MSIDFPEFMFFFWVFLIQCVIWNVLFQVDCDVVKIDVQCAVQGDVVLECIHLDVESDRETMMFRVMFNTAFIRSNILMLGSDDLDILWDAKERFPKDFRAEVNVFHICFKV